MRRLDVVCTTSERDRAVLRLAVPGVRVAVALNGVDLEEHPPRHWLCKNPRMSHQPLRIVPVALLPLFVMTVALTTLTAHSRGTRRNA